MHAREAVRQSPHNSGYRALLASVLEAGGNHEGAEREMLAAVERAPFDVSLRWRLANLLLRERKLVESLKEFRIATKGKPSLLPGTIDMIWRASNGNVEAVQEITDDSPTAQLCLARFLLKQSRVQQAVEVFGRIDGSARAAAVETPAFFDELMALGRMVEARAAWSGLFGGTQDVSEIVWNGSFESEPLKSLTHFDWSLRASEFARLAIDGSNGHTGSRSLRVDFLGKDTTRLENEIRQLVLVQPDVRYRIECFVRTQDLVTPEGPRLVVWDASGVLLVSSDPVAEGSESWRRLTAEFTAPKTAGRAVGVYVGIQRRPRFSYDDPTRGTLWLDDVKIDARRQLRSDSQ
jgi:hypothetical protein